ncbi:hypothetical protein [Homoserinimonas hongtaonis]|uniref:hypothetical protein n=1 Tax=Homoserinimonas hongtaonis TaxID=2079791 RepID=UPI000D3A795F|nr:hypothetical protein [Salinibacterium hongtaonis]AWB88808.1 hypothetical protein C2138_03935 [Salinibacterium hongtaonis]
MVHDPAGEGWLHGPRGRRAIASLLASAEPALWTLQWHAAQAPRDSGMTEEFAQSIVEFADANPNDFNDEAVRECLFDATSSAMYWQPPDEVDLLLASPAIVAALTPVARRVAASPASAWWRSPVDLDNQHYVQWTGDPTIDPPLLSGAADRVAAWKAKSLASERNAAAMSAELSSRWTGAWWSTPAHANLVTTTCGLPELGAANLAFIEDTLGWTTATVWPLRPGSGCRVYEITGPDAWTALVGRYPLDVTRSRRPDWFHTTGHDGPWWIPDWSAVAGDFDAVHLTVSGYLSTAGRALPAGGAHTVFAGWGPDETWWLGDVLELAGDPVDWRRDYASPSNTAWQRA